MAFKYLFNLVFIIAISTTVFANNTESQASNSANSSADFPLTLLAANIDTLSAGTLAERILNQKLTSGSKEMVELAHQDARLLVCMQIGEISAVSKSFLENVKKHITASEYESLVASYDKIKIPCTDRYLVRENADEETYNRLLDLTTTLMKLYQKYKNN